MPDVGVKLVTPTVGSCGEDISGEENVAMGKDIWLIEDENDEPIAIGLFAVALLKVGLVQLPIVGVLEPPADDPNEATLPIPPTPPDIIADGLNPGAFDAMVCTFDKETSRINSKIMAAVSYKLRRDKFSPTFDLD